MARRVTLVRIVVGQPLPFPLEIGAGEDREYRITWIEADDSPNAGQPVNFTGFVETTATVRDQNGIEIVSRDGSVFGSPTAGTLSYVFQHNDTAGQAAQTYKIDVWWKDASNETQLLKPASFEITESEFAGATPTQPPPLPIFSGPFLGPYKVVFDGSSAQQPVTFPALPAPPQAVCIVSVETDSTEAVIPYVVKSSKTTTGAIIGVNDDLVADVWVLVLP